MLSALLHLSCEEPERIWGNLYDKNHQLSPNEWAPKSLTVVPLSKNSLSLVWEYSRVGIEGFKIDRKGNSNDWSIEYAVIDKEQRQWVDTLAFASKTISYDYRLYCYYESNISDYSIVSFIDKTPCVINLAGNYSNNSINLSWLRCQDSDFSNYKLYESTLEDMSNQKLIFETEDSIKQNLTITTIGEGGYRYYQIIVENIRGMKNMSNIIEIQIP